MAATPIADQIAAAAGCPVLSTERVAGGDISQAYRARLDDGRWLFAKTHPDPPPQFFAAEADGLGRLAAAGAVRTPEVIAHTETMLVLEWIERGHTLAGDRLGRELARLHQTATGSFGLDRDNFVGTVAQDNTPSATWPEFYASRRLEPLVKRNVDNKRLAPGTITTFSRLTRRIGELCGPPEPPALLHGDLWGGNCIGTDPEGQPVLIDPAVYGGHREVDLAMMRLFGGFDAAVFAAYRETYPLADGHHDRVQLYQLYPLLVHVALFGRGYARSFLDALRRYA